MVEKTALFCLTTEAMPVEAFDLPEEEVYKGLDIIGKLVRLVRIVDDSSR